MENRETSFWLDRPVLVTGCTGLLGSWLTVALVDGGAQVVGLIRDQVPHSHLHRSGYQDRIVVVRGDVTDYALLERTLNEYEVETVFHLAAQTTVTVANRAPLPTLETNIKGTWTVLGAARRSPTVRRVIVASSDKAYGTLETLSYTDAQVWAGEHAGGTPAGEGRTLPRVTWVRLDVRDPASVARAVDRSDPEMVFHLAAISAAGPGVDPMLTVAVNVGGTVHLLEALRSRKVRRVVLAGTCYEYGARDTVEGLDPYNIYAASKVAAWAFARAYWRSLGLPATVVRPFQVYGPGQPPQALIPSAIRAALAGEDFRMTRGEQQRDFVFVEDVVEGSLAAAAAPGVEGESLDLGTGQAYAVREVIERVWAMTGATGQIRAGALPYRPGEVMHLAADADRTARLTGWRAKIGLEEGLRRTVDWVRAEMA